jgi:kynurenine formamidase
MREVKRDGTVSYGADDEIGALNLLTPERLLAAAKLIQHGRGYDLDAGRSMGLPLGPGQPQLTVVSYRTSRGLMMTGDYFPDSPNGDRQGFNSELVMSSMHTGCHIDALAHITLGADAHWYNGYRAQDHLGDFGPRRADVSAYPPILGRGVLADVAGARGVERLPAGYGISGDELQSVLNAQGTSVAEGDVVLIRTGIMRDWPDAAKMAEADGSGLRLDGARWLADELRVAAVGADNASVEMLPSGDPARPQPVHAFLLVERGVPLLEFVYLEELARDRVYEFFFVALPLKIAGATGSMLRPVAVI